MKNDDKWRQKYYEDKAYNYIDNYVCSDECAISIYKNEILNIFNISKDIKLEDLVNSINNLGSVKFECYSDKFNFYTNLGFCPISVCKWDDREAPYDWLEFNGMLDKQGNSIPELLNNPKHIISYPRYDIIFFIHVENSIDITYNEWLQKVEYSANYQEAKQKRDLIFKKFMKGN